MARVQRLVVDGQITWTLMERPLGNGDEVELRLRGNQGWLPARIDGLPDRLIVAFSADDGRPVRATAEDADLRWP